MREALVSSTWSSTTSTIQRVKTTATTASAGTSATPATYSDSSADVRGHHTIRSRLCRPKPLAQTVPGGGGLVQTREFRADHFGHDAGPWTRLTVYFNPIDLRGSGHSHRSGDLPENVVPRLLRPLLANGDRKSTRLNSSHITISYAVFCLKKKNTECIDCNLTVQLRRKDVYEP